MLTADELRQWADYLDNPELVRPGQVNPAAAPEMDEVLGEALRVIDTNIPNGWKVVVPGISRKIRAVLAKSRET